MVDHVEVERTEGGGATASVESERDSRPEDVEGGGGEESTEPGTMRVSGRAARELPWNSRCLTRSILRQLANKLGVPMSPWLETLSLYLRAS